MSKHSKYTYCPQCTCKTVYWQGKPNGEDNYRCRKKDCGFYFFTISNAKIDRENAAAWQAANKEQS